MLLVDLDALLCILLLDEWWTTLSLQHWEHALWYST